jgi:hypothetical protein
MAMVMSSVSPVLASHVLSVQCARSNGATVSAS